MALRAGVSASEIAGDDGRTRSYRAVTTTLVFPGTLRKQALEIRQYR